MFYALLKTIHVLSVLAWVGGMLFAHFFLRPSVASLEPAVRLTLMRNVLGRFFSAVLWLGSAAIATGVVMIGMGQKLSSMGGGHAMPMSWMVMALLGILMFAIFGHIRFVLFKRLRVAVDQSDWASGGGALNSIRQWVSVNLAIGIAIIVIVFVMPSI